MATRTQIPMKSPSVPKPEFAPGKLLHRESSPEGPASVSGAVHDAISSPGQPLDGATRKFFEPRFGHDFSKVRVHTDPQAAQSAQAEGAIAYTVGNHLVFGANRYQPRTGMGRAIIAHELAHTLQQQKGTRDSDGEEGALERDADNAALAATLNRPVAVSSGPAPRVQFLKVTPGALGKALEPFTIQNKIPDRAIRLLQSSPTFMKIAAIIDRNYVWRGDSAQTGEFSDSQRGPDRRILNGPFKGKRELFDVQFGKPELEPHEAAPEPGSDKVSGDQIMIGSTNVPEFISDLAHEATHAAQLVDSSTPPPQSVQEQVNAAIKNEVGARTSEAQVLGEISAPDVRAQAAQVGTRVPAEVERDIPPAFGLTYVEVAVFGYRLRDAMKKDGISEADAKQIRDDVGKEFGGKKPPKEGFHFKPSLNATGQFELSDYAEAWFDRMQAQADWKDFEKNHQPSDPDYAAEKERLIQDHATRFFEGQVYYHPLAKPPAKP